jgi:hypothetical protein
MRLIHCPPLSFLTSVLVILLCLCAACVFGPFGSGQTTQNNTDVGIVAITGNYLPKSFTLEEALSAVTGNYPNQVNGSLQNPTVYNIRGRNHVSGNLQNLTIYYVRGDNMDESGRAEQWIFGTHEGNSTSMLIYDYTGITTIAWQGLLPEQEINTADILSPADIIKTVYPEYQNITGNFEFEMSNGEYRVTGPSGSHPREYRINATTGVLIATYD